VGAVGYMLTHSGSAPTSDLPTLMLALPAIAVSWFGFAASENDAFLGSSYLARLSLVWTGVVSIAAIVTFLVHEPPPASSGSHFALLGIPDLAWVVLTSLSFLNFIYITYRFAVRLNYYNALRDRTETE